MYIPITPNNNTAVEQAKALSRELYKISIPDERYGEGYVFQWLEKGDSVMMKVDPAYMIPVGQGVNLTKLILMLGGVSAEDRLQLAAYIDSKQGEQIPFGAILPKGIPQYTEQDMIDMGFLTTDE